MKLSALYIWPAYTVRVAFEEGPPVVVCFGLRGLLDTIPRLPVELYFIELYGTVFRVATAAVHESGSWTLNFGDGSEFSSSNPCGQPRRGIV